MKPHLLFLLVFPILLAPRAEAQQPDGASAPGLLVMAHGGDPAWNAAVEAAVAPLRERYPVALAFGMADPHSLEGALDSLEARGVERVAVVRLFLDGRSFLHQTEYFLGLREDPPARFLLHGPGGHGSHGGGHGSDHGSSHGSDHGSSHGAGHGSAPSATADEGETPPQIQHSLDIALSLDGLMQARQVGTILASRVSTLSTDPANESVLVLAHGTGDDVENARWVAAMEHLSTPLRALGFHSVRTETLREDWPESRAAAERAIRSYVSAEAGDGRRVLVVPFRLAGFGPYRQVLEGLSYEAVEEGLLPHTAITEWIEAEYHALVAR